MENVEIVREQLTNVAGNNKYIQHMITCNETPKGGWYQQVLSLENFVSRVHKHARAVNAGDTHAATSRLRHVRNEELRFFKSDDERRSNKVRIKKHRSVWAFYRSIGHKHKSTATLKFLFKCKV